jgi:hypothetical protein
MWYREMVQATAVDSITIGRLNSDARHSHIRGEKRGQLSASAGQPPIAGRAHPRLTTSASAMLKRSGVASPHQQVGTRDVRSDPVHKTIHPCAAP